jgi:tetrahydromethanopterin S-methyltransferase subunit G
MDGEIENDKHIKALENENNQLKSRLEEIKRKAEFLQFLILNA